MTTLSKSILSGLAAPLVASVIFGWVCYSANPNSRLPTGSEEGDGIAAPKWHSAVVDLERRLQS